MTLVHDTRIAEETEMQWHNSETSKQMTHVHVLATYSAYD